MRDAALQIAKVFAVWLTFAIDPAIGFVLFGAVVADMTVGRS